jgi:hypothetical protein
VADSKIMTLLALSRSSRRRDFKTFYNGFVLGVLRRYFPGAPGYERYNCAHERRAGAFFPASRWAKG